MLVQEFPDLARAYGVSSVPLTVIEPLDTGKPVFGQGTSILGAQPEAAFIAAVAEVGEANGEGGGSAS